MAEASSDREEEIGWYGGICIDVLVDQGLVFQLHPLRWGEGTPKPCQNPINILEHPEQPPLKQGTHGKEQNNKDLENTRMSLSKLRFIKDEFFLSISPISFSQNTGKRNFFGQKKEEMETIKAKRISGCWSIFSPKTPFTSHKKKTKQNIFEDKTNPREAKEEEKIQLFR